MKGQHEWTSQGLFDAMRAGKPVDINGLHGVINTLQREDGSGRSWNITMGCGPTWNEAKTTYLRCKS